MKINLIGDIALFSSYARNGIDPFEQVGSKLQDCDLLVGNFEFPFTNYIKKQKLGATPVYSVPTTQAYLLDNIKFDAVSLANNHIMDWGEEGLITTQSILQDRKIKFFGAGRSLATANRPIIFEKNGIKVAFGGYCKKGSYSATQNSPGAAVIDKEIICQEIEKYRKVADFIFLSMHWGTEFVNIPDPKDVTLAHELIDAGADVIWGHHPHVIQGYEYYGNGLILYSLGSYIYSPFEELVRCDKKIKERQESIIGHVSLSSNKPVFDYTPCRLNKLNIPEQMDEINKNLFDQKMKEYCQQIYLPEKYYSEAGSSLFKREIVTYLLLFKKNPIKTLIQFFKKFKVKYLFILYKTYFVKMKYYKIILLHLRKIKIR